MLRAADVIGYLVHFYLGGHQCTVRASVQTPSTSTSSSSFTSASASGEGSMGTGRAEAKGEGKEGVEPAVKSQPGDKQLVGPALADEGQNDQDDDMRAAMTLSGAFSPAPPKTAPPKAPGIEPQLQLQPEELMLSKKDDAAKHTTEDGKKVDRQESVVDLQTLLAPLPVLAPVVEKHKLPEVQPLLGAILSLLQPTSATATTAFQTSMGKQVEASLALV